MVSCATSLLVIGMSFFFYVFVHKLGLTYEAMRKGDLNPWLLVSVIVLMVFVSFGDIIVRRINSRRHLKSPAALGSRSSFER